jgi:hypothetical protein
MRPERNHKNRWKLLKDKPTNIDHGIEEQFRPERLRSTGRGIVLAGHKGQLLKIEEAERQKT